MSAKRRLWVLVIIVAVPALVVSILSSPRPARGQTDEDAIIGLGVAALAFLNEEDIDAVLEEAELAADFGDPAAFFFIDAAVGAGLYNPFRGNQVEYDPAVAGTADITHVFGAVFNPNPNTITLGHETGPLLGVGPDGLFDMNGATDHELPPLYPGAGPSSFEELGDMLTNAMGISPEGVTAVNGADVNVVRHSFDTTTPLNGHPVFLLGTRVRNPRPVDSCPGVLRDIGIFFDRVDLVNWDDTTGANPELFDDFFYAGDTAVVANCFDGPPAADVIRAFQGAGVGFADQTANAISIWGPYGTLHLIHGGDVVGATHLRWIEFVTDALTSFQPPTVAASAYPGDLMTLSPLADVTHFYFDPTLVRETATSSTSSTTSSTSSTTTTITLTDPGDIPAGGNLERGVFSRFFWVPILIGGFLIIVGITVYWQTRERGKPGYPIPGDDDGDDPRDTPPPQIYGEEIEEACCDWQVYFNDGGQLVALREMDIACHECCKYEITVKTKILAHGQAAHASQDDDERLRLPDYDFSWRWVDLYGHATARSGPAGRLDWMQGYGDPTDQAGLSSDEPYVQRVPLAERPEVAAHLDHHEVTYIDVVLKSGCPEYDNEYSLSGETEVGVMATAECTNDSQAPECPVELAATGYFWGEIYGDLWVMAGEGLGADPDELEPLAQRVDGDFEEGDDSRRLQARAYELSHAHTGDLAREKPTYENTSSDSNSTVIRFDDAHLRVLSEAEADAGLIVPRQARPTTERVSAHVEGQFHHQVGVIGEMTPKNCEANNCGGHGPCMCAPKFVLEVSGNEAYVEVDGEKHSIYRIPNSADRNAPPAPGPAKEWELPS